jgi:hypothetical protein
MATAGKGGMEENYGGENEGEGEGEGEAEGEYGGDHQWTVTSMVASVPLWACWAGVFLLIGCASLVCFVYMRDDLVRAWHRRQAAQAARAMDIADDDELMPVSSWLGTTQPVKVAIEVNGVTHRIGASRDGMGSVSRVPFVLNDACYESGYPELVDLDLVDLLLSKKAELSYVDKDGDIRRFDGSITVVDLMAAKSIHVRVL